MPLRPPRTLHERLCALLLVLAFLPTAAWAEDGKTAAPPAKKAPQPKAQPNPLVIGEYALSVEQVVDGDTIRLPEGKGSIRILGLDCEEVFKDEKTRKAAAADFAAYAKAQRGESKRPVKYGTPAGEAAREHLKALVTGFSRMRLERDRVGARDRGHYGRVLAHVFLLNADGKQVNVAEAMIRAGHSLNFVKYGRSARFFGAFAKAQNEARLAQRGIWAPDGPKQYPDYDERMFWWSARAAQVTKWNDQHRAKLDHVTLGEPEADKKLAALVGKQATVFGVFDRELEIKKGDKRIFLLSHQRRRGFPLVVFDLDVAKAIDAQERFHSMYVTVRGTVTLYRGRPQIVIAKASQVSTE